jgi:hypothetical protein
MIGVRRSSVSLDAAQLREAGLIAYRRGHVDILDLMLATAATIGIGIAATSNASARVVYNLPQRGSVVRSFRPP